MFLSICLDDEEFGRELVEEGGWTSLVHAFTSNQSRIAAKACWGIVQVPFLVVARDGLTIASGPPTKVTLAALATILDSEAPAGSPKGEFIFNSEDF